MKKNKIIAFISVAIIIFGLSACSNKKSVENIKNNNQVHNVENNVSKQNDKNESSKDKLDNDTIKKDIQIDGIETKKNTQKDMQIDGTETKKNIQKDTQKKNNSDIKNSQNIKSASDVSKTKLEVNDIKYDPVFSFLQVRVNNVKLVESLSVYLDGKQYKYDLKKDMKVKDEKNLIIIKNINGQFKKGKVVIKDTKKKEISKEF